MSKAVIILFAVVNIFCSVDFIKGQESDAVKNEASEAVDTIEGDFIFIEGDVKIRQKDQMEWTTVTETTKLSEGAEIKLGKNSYAEVKLGQDNKMQVNEETMVAVQNELKKTSLDIIYGSLKAKVKKIPGEKLEVRTPVSVAAVRGTEFAVAYEQKDTAEVEVYDGEVAFQNITEKGEGEEITVSKNQWAKSSTDLKPILMGKITAIKALRWKHLQAKKQAFINLRTLKRINMNELRLKHKFKIASDPAKRQQIEKSMAELTDLKAETQDAYADNKKTLANTSREYKKIRIKSSSDRLKFIKQIRKKNKAARLRKIKKAKERIRERKKDIKRKRHKK